MIFKCLIFIGVIKHVCVRAIASVMFTSLRSYIFTFTFHFHALEKEMATHSSVLAWRVPRDGGAWWAAIYGVAESDTTEVNLAAAYHNPPGFSVHGILQARIQERVAVPSSRGSF